MKLKAHAKTPGPCCLVGCTLPGTKIFEADGLRLLACTEGHAKAVLSKVQAVVKACGATREQRDEALRLFNSIQPAPVPSEDEGDFEEI